MCQASAWTNVDMSYVRLSENQLRVISFTPAISYKNNFTKIWFKSRIGMVMIQQTNDEPVYWYIQASPDLIEFRDV